MQVILLERIEKLGNMGDEVTVKPGHARNFLLPQGKALRASKENRAYFEARRGELEKLNAERKGEAQTYADRLDGLRVVMVRQAGEKGQLYGSVSARDICDEMREMGYSLQRNQVELAQPIKDLGQYSVRLALHAEVDAHITVQVVRNRQDAEVVAEEAESSGEAAVAAPVEMKEAEEMGISEI